MPEKSVKSNVIVEQPKLIMFKCKFCGESKPLDEMVILRYYYPILAACKECAKGPRAEAAVELSN